MTGIFFEIGIVVIVATACALAARLWKLPPLVGYIITGILLGPLGARLIQNQETFEALKQLGVALLLFLVGLELDWNKAKHQLHTASVLGIIQVVGSFAAGFVLAIALHQSLLVGTYLGIALAFSSTVIVVKLLSESRDLNALHGRLAVGILLVQDVLAILVLVVMSGIMTPSALSIPSLLFLLLIKTSAILALTWVVSQYALPPLFARIARSGELLFLASLAWCFVFTLAITRYGFPLEIGAFLAGISLASLPYSLDIMNRLRALRDFFVILFFVSIGSSLIIPSLSYALFTLALTLLTIIGKPAIAFLTLAGRGYKSRTSFLAALTQGQLSEFSLIIIGLGLEHGQISPALASSITFTAIISIFASTILLTQRNWLYSKLRHILHPFERRRVKSLPGMPEEQAFSEHIIIFGYHRMGYHILKKLRQLDREVLVIDFNPDILRKLKEQKVNCLYGDAQDEEILETARAAKAYLVISTIPHRDETLFLLEQMKRLKSTARVIVTAHNIDDALDYYKIGASYVILPHLLGGEHVADLITHYEKHSLGEFMHHRAEEIKLLRAKNNALYYD